MTAHSPKLLQAPEPPPKCSTCSYLPGNGRVMVIATAALLPVEQAIGGVKVKAVFNKRSVSVAIKKKLNEIVQRARAQEPPLHLKFEVLLELEIDAPSLAEDWPWQALAALDCVVADRALRGLWPQQHTVLLGQCEEQGDNPRLLPLAPSAHLAALAAIRDVADLGAVRLVLPPSFDAASSALHQAIRERHPALEYWEVSRLSGLLKNSSAAGAMASSTVFFPVVDGIQELLPLTVKLLEVSQADETQIQITGLIGSAAEILLWQQHIRNLLNAIRAKERSDTPKHWHTIVNFPAKPFSGLSYELALITAERIARGREFPMPSGERLIATGSVWHVKANAEFANLGEVNLPLDRLKDKGDLFLQDAQPGERILLPANWRIHFCEWREKLQEKNVTVAYVANVLMLD